MSMKRAAVRALTGILAVALIAGGSTSAYAADEAGVALAPVAVKPAERTAAQLEAAVREELAEDFAAAEREEKEAQAGRVQAAAIAVPAALIAWVAVCASGAATSVGYETVKELIAKGQLPKVRELLAHAIAGCLLTGAGSLLYKGCKAIPPCNKALKKIINQAVERIIREIRG